MSKRPAFDMKALAAKKAKMDQQTASLSSAPQSSRNPYLANPVQPEAALQLFLNQVRSSARKFLPEPNAVVKKPFCEVEARLGILSVPHASPRRRVTSQGAKRVNGKVARAFDCRAPASCQMLSGVSRTHFGRWAVVSSEASPIQMALGVRKGSDWRQDLQEEEYVETVYSGYAGERRVCYPGLHTIGRNSNLVGTFESKEKLLNMDLTIPAAKYDMRITLSSEKELDSNVPNQPPPGWTCQRIKRRRSYSRRDKSIVWQIDVTEVTTTMKDNPGHSTVDYEIEMELRDTILLQLINESDVAELQKTTKQLAQQLWWIMSQLNPLHDELDVDECLQDHPNRKAVQLALATCGALKQFSDSRGRSNAYESPIKNSNQPPSPSLSNYKFVGCMPVNFSRHHIDEIQRAPADAYYMSEKTDGVRHFLVFTDDTAVLVDRAMRGKQPKPVGGSTEDPFASILGLINPGTVLDGEVVMNRRGSTPRPIFIVFDVLALSPTEAVLHLPFSKRLHHLRQASFRTPTCQRDMFDEKLVANPNVPLPLVRKNFVVRTAVDDLLTHVVEERGMRCFKKGDVHNHLTDGIIFQPNLPYTCGTDIHLLKWKYLDTVTIDVEIQGLMEMDDDETLRVACLGDEQTRVDMTRHINLPVSERLRMEADRYDTDGCKIMEVGFDPESGEWYYLTMRGDKIAPNHISTVLGTLLELGECLTTDELRFRMSVPSGARDTYRRDMRRMLSQLLSHQRRQLQQQKQPSTSK